jgi:predicted AAA+ superfamily ATPase
MVVEEVLRRLNAMGFGYQATYYRTGGGAEVDLDLVLEGAFGLVAVEIKYTSTVDRRDFRGLRDFIAAHKARLGVVINNDAVPRIYEDRMVGMPFTCL